MTETELRLPITGGDPKREYVREVFAGIAPRYDLLNHLLSCNADRGWRRAAVDALEESERAEYLDKS